MKKSIKAFCIRDYGRLSDEVIEQLYAGYSLHKDMPDIKLFRRGQLGRRAYSEPCIKNKISC